ncbi:MAG: multidrug effflux MFS transporter [Pseudomonadota bacterium]
MIPSFTLSQKEQRILIMILGVIAGLGPFSVDMYLPGFPVIANDLNASIGQVSLTLTSYFIGISLGQLFYGPLVDRYGRKKPLLIGFAFYVIAAVGCAFAPTVEWLIGLRLMLALGSCVGIVASQSIVRDCFPNSEVARVFSTLMLVMGVAPMIAPTLGGYVIAHFGWRYVFGSLACICLFMMFLIKRFVPETKAFDSTISLRFLPVLKSYRNTLRNKNFLIYGFAGSAVMGSLFAYIAGSPHVFMEIYGFSEKTYGWIFALNAFGLILGSQVNRYLLKKYTTGFLIQRVSILLVLCAIGLLLSLKIQIHEFQVLGLLFLYLFFSGFLYPNTNAMALSTFQNNIGVASALLGSCRMFAGAATSISIAVFHDGSINPMILTMSLCTLGACFMVKRPSINNNF